MRAWCSLADLLQIGFVAGDMKDPEGDLGVIINGSMISVVTGFVLMNAALYIVLPMSAIRATQTVAVVSTLPRRHL